MNGTQPTTRCPHRWRVANVVLSLPGQALTPAPLAAHCRLCGADRTFLASLEAGPRNQGYYAQARARKAAKAEAGT